MHVKPRKRSVTRVSRGFSQSSDAADRSVSRRLSALTTDGHCRNDPMCAARSCSAACETSVRRRVEERGGPQFLILLVEPSGIEPLTS